MASRRLIYGVIFVGLVVATGWGACVEGDSTKIEQVDSATIADVQDSQNPLDDGAIGPDGTGQDGSTAADGLTADTVADGDSGADMADTNTPNPDVDNGTNRCVPQLPGNVVAVDLSPYVSDFAPGRTFAKEVTNDADLVSGPAQTGSLGDFVIGNEVARFVVRGPKRVMGPCPWGGAVLDGDIVRDDGEPGQDNMGATCVFVNIGRTQLVERVQVLADGSDGCPAILAMTGRDTVNDFLNAPNLLKTYGINIEIAFDPDKDLSLAMTTYYIVRPNEPTMRVVTAMRNDGDETQPILAGDVIDSGGVVEFFNPVSSLKGFGYSSIAPETMDFMGFVGQNASHGYAPPALADQDGKMGPGAAYLAVSGVVGCVIGTVDAFTSLLADLSEPVAGVVLLAPGETTAIDRLIAVGTGSLSSVTDAIFAARGLETGRVTGFVHDPDKIGVGDVRVSFIDEEQRAQTQAKTEADGTFSANLPLGTYTLKIWSESHAMLSDVTVTVESGAEVSVEVPVGGTGMVEVFCEDTAAAPLPCKVTVMCDGTCPWFASPLVRDVGTDNDYKNLYRFTGMDGKAEFKLAPGPYRVIATRGPEYSVWPLDVHETNGTPVDLKPGEKTTLTATLARVVDTNDWLSGDFHVHGINSPDAPVSLEDRVRTFLGEGVDVLVSTDHDFITDYAPTVNKLGAASLLATMIGEELTTFDYGHFNGFPLEVDPTSQNGGAVDWGNGEDKGKHPDAIFDALHAFAGDQVVQINHAESGYFGATKLNPVTGVTLTDPAFFRLEPVTPDPVTGNTHLWSEKFTAMEIYNGHSESKLRRLFNYWVTFLNRGFRVTATAVSDTHKVVKSEAGGPRTFVHMPNQATVRPFAQAAFVQAVNDGRAFGSNGPILSLKLLKTDDITATIGETLRVPESGPVTLRLTVQTPSWYKVDRMRVFSNVTDATFDDGWKINDAWPTPVAEKTFQMEAADLQPGIEGGESYPRYVKTVEVTLDVTVDSYYVVVVDATTAAGSLWPYLRSKSVMALAYTNPVFVDVGGDGWTPPMDATKLAGKPAPKNEQNQATRILGPGSSREEFNDILQIVGPKCEEIHDLDPHGHRHR